MHKQTLAEQLNRIASLFHVGLFPDEGPFQDVFYVNSGPPLSLIKDGPKLFQTFVDDLLSSLPGVEGTLSRELIINELISLVAAKKVNDELFSPIEANRFKQTLYDRPLNKYNVVRPIFGVEIALDAAPMLFGDFKIDFGRRLLCANQESTERANVLKPEDESRLFIQCTVTARDAKRASELADAFFYRFELVFRFLIGRRTGRVEVGIVNYSGAQMRDRFMFADDGRLLAHGSSWQGALQHFLLGDPRFPTPTPPLIKLFELITRPSNEFERHILRCAEWTGQAIGEPNEASALVKAAIALEVLFSANEKALITPSIMAQISESCAFLLGDENGSPELVERKVKQLYGVRSAVVHSGKDSVDSGDLDAFINICRDIVILLLSGDKFLGIDSMAKLAQYFRSRKYADFKKSEPSAARPTQTATAFGAE